MASVLNFPTVGDLIAELQKYPSQSNVIIEDADTMWTIDHIHIRIADNFYGPDKDAVILWGEYHEMTSKDPREPS